MDFYPEVGKDRVHCGPSNVTIAGAAWFPGKRRGR
jgi:hypothetical protein